MKKILILITAIITLSMTACSPTLEKEIEVTPDTQATQSQTVSEETKEEVKAEEIPKQAIETKALLYTVERVVDGDTIVVNLNGISEKVRLIGIDTPESVHPDEAKNVPSGKIASDFTKNKLEGSSVALEFDSQERDRYGRLLAYVWIDNVMFNKTLLSEGMAQVATFPPNVKYTNDFIALERQAREGSVGLWSQNTISSEPTVSQPQPQASTVNNEKSYIGNKNTKKFHSPTCSSVGQMNESNKVSLTSREEAMNNGYVPCKRCNP